MGISDQLLRWKGIEATLKIAESQNAKVVIIGSSKDGIPIILDTKYARLTVTVPDLSASHRYRTASQDV